MSVTISDSVLLAQLLGKGTVDVKDASGAVVGRFTPTLKMSFPEFGVTDEELLREIRDPNTKWHTPEQVMARLREIDRCTG